MNSGSDSADWRVIQKKPQVAKNFDCKGKQNTKATLIKKPLPDIRERLSVGIACCRFNAGRPELLLVCKRYSYAYSIFVHGRYNSNSNAEIIKLLNGMTIEEKHDLMSLNFAQIWYRIWLNNTVRNSSYFLAKNKFESTFCADAGARLFKLITKSTHSSKIWEIPKGRKKNKSESSIHCAIREFQEESRISKGSYKIWVDAVRSYSYIDDGIKYTNQYFLAFTKHKIEPRIDFSAREQIEELSDIRWMNIDEIRRIDETGRLANFVKPIFNFMKKHAKR